MSTLCVECPWPSNPPFGRFVPSPTNPSTSALLLCCPGYTHFPTSVITCTSDGTWSLPPSTMSCTPAVALLTGGTSVKERNVEILSSNGNCNMVLPSIDDGKDSMTGEDLVRRSHTVDLVDHEVILCGGDETDIKRSCLTMDSSRNFTWTHHSETLEKREHHVSAVLGRTLYLISGEGGDEDEEIAISAESNAGNGWEMEGWWLRRQRWRACAVTLDGPEYVGKVVILSGGFTNSVELVSLLDGEAVELPSMNFDRNSFGCVVTKIDGSDAILVAGGHWVEDGEDYVDDGTSEFLNLSTMTWSMAGNLTKSRSDLQLLAFSDRVVAVGGWGGWQDNRPLDTIEEFDPITKQWKDTGEVILQARESFAVTYLPQILFCNEN